MQNIANQVKLFAIKAFNAVAKLNVVHAEDDISEKINDGINQALKTLRSIVNPIATVAVVICGIYLVAGQGDPQTTKKAKTWGLTILIGLLIINLADKIVSWGSGIGA